MFSETKLEQKPGFELIPNNCIITTVQLIPKSILLDLVYPNLRFNVIHSIIKEQNINFILFNRLAREIHLYRQHNPNDEHKSIDDLNFILASFEIS